MNAASMTGVDAGRLAPAAAGDPDSEPRALEPTVGRTYTPPAQANLEAVAAYVVSLGPTFQPAADSFLHNVTQADYLRFRSEYDLRMRNEAAKCKKEREAQRREDGPRLLELRRKGEAYAQQDFDDRIRLLIEKADSMLKDRSTGQETIDVRCEAPNLQSLEEFLVHVNILC